ncbi:flavoprotein-like protein [Aspergillus cavernicola]|uniref:Flavoprotein-like protein n=1 Tax=Aspergillus cavernicola TaxID=176166 RepID=A0ABR4HUM0_9EURO
MAKKIALVTSSTRNPRLNPFITQYIHDLLSSQAAVVSGQVTIEILDLADQNLPLYNEPAVPSRLPASNPTPHYVYEHTQAWSATVRGYDGFIFVTPQYNWSIPASLKNALDYLFYEWKGKPAGIVTYGGRGGGKAAEHLRGVLAGLRMKVIEAGVCLPVKITTMENFLEIGGFDSEDRKTWQESGMEELVKVIFVALLEILNKAP